MSWVPQAGKRAQVKSICPGGQSLIPGTKLRWEEKINSFETCPLVSTRAHGGTNTDSAHIHRNNNDMHCESLREVSLVQTVV